MKKITLFIAAFLISTLAISQKKEKLKGSKIVTIEKKDVASFDALEVEDDLEVSLIKGDKNEVELEADDNLQDAIMLKRNGNVLIISAVKEVTSFKKFTIRVTYTDSFRSVVAKDKSKINALEEIKLDEISFKGLGSAKLFLNISTKNFSITASDKARIEMNAKAESGTIIMSKNSELKALISATDLKCDLYQKATATIEGDAIDLKLRLDNNAAFSGKKFTTQTLNLTAEAYSNSSVLVEKNASIQAFGSSEIQIFGEPKIELIKFTDSATLYKKPSK